MTEVSQRGLLALGVVTLILLLIAAAIGVGAIQWATWQRMTLIDLQIQRLQTEFARMDERTKDLKPCSDPKGER